MRTFRSRCCSWLLMVGLSTLLGACAKPTPAAQSAPVVAGTPISFEFFAPDHTRLSHADVRGRVTVLAFGTSYGLATQLLAEELARLASQHKPRINVALVMMEPVSNQVFVATFKESLGLSYPVVLVDDATLHGFGPFGAFKAMPAAVVLDRQGRLVWSDEGALSIERIKQEVVAVQRSDAR